MRNWLAARASEATTHLGAAVVAVSAYAAASTDDVVEAAHDLTGGHVSRATVRVAAALASMVGGVLIGTPARR